MQRCLLVVALVLFYDNLGKFGAQGASLDREGPGDLAAGLVRREVQKVSYIPNDVHLGRVGENFVQKRVSRSQQNDRDASSDITICNDNFVAGHADGSGECLPGHTHIITEQMCEKAAAAAKAPLGTPWPTPRAQDPIAGNINTHPKGCYVKETVSGEVTYHFNGISDEIPTPHIEDGEAAVCRRDKLKFGTIDTNNCNSSEYKILFNEDICEEAAKCLRYMHDGSMDMDFDINVMDMKNHDVYPAGCFVHPTETPREVYYNPEKQGEAKLTLPTNPKGTIICIAESVVIKPAPTPAPVVEASANATEESNATSGL